MQSRKNILIREILIALLLISFFIVNISNQDDIKSNIEGNRFNNEQAIIDSFELFQKEGYNGTLDDFKTLMAANDEAFNLMFELVSNEGYADTKEDYAALIGVKKNLMEKLYNALFEAGDYTKYFEELKQQFGFGEKKMDKFTKLYNYLKEQGLTDLSAEEFKVEYASGTDKNSELYSYLKDESLTDLSAEEFNVEYFSALKKKDESIFPSEEVVTELPTTQEVEVSTESDASFTEPQKIFNQYVDEIDADFTGQEEEFAVPEMRYKLGDYGFKFEETGMFGDKMKVTAPNGKKITIDLDETVEGGFFTKSDKETAETLKDFLKKNQDVEQQFNREEEEYIKEKARIKDEKDVEEGVAELNLRAEEYNDDVKTYVAKSAELKEMKEVYGNLTSEQMLGEYNEGYKKYLDLKQNLKEEAKRLSRENDGIELQGMRLDRNVGKWSEMKRRQGTWYGNLGIPALLGFCTFIIFNLWFSIFLIRKI